MMQEVTASGGGGFTLAIEASTYRGSVAVIDGSVVMATGEVAMRGATEERLMPAVAAAMASAGVTPDSLARVVCGAGPGSFTSLRIAAAIARGIVMPWGASLLAVPSQLLVLAGGDEPLPAGRYLVVTDALRGELFAVEGVVGEAGEPALVGSVERRDGAFVAEWAERSGLTRVGPAEALERWPHARGVAALLPALAGEPSVDLAGWEPEYGRLAEAQVKWEVVHGRALSTG